MEKIEQIRTEKELVDFLTGWDYSDWAWTGIDDPQPDIYEVSAGEILDQSPVTIEEEGEWIVFRDEIPWAIHRDLWRDARLVTLYMVRVPSGCPYELVWHSTHATRAEAEEVLASEVKA